MSATDTTSATDTKTATDTTTPAGSTAPAEATAPGAAPVADPDPGPATEEGERRVQGGSGNERAWDRTSDLAPGRPGAGARTASVLSAVLYALRRTLTRSAAVLALLLVWEAAPRLALVDRTFLPPFSTVAVAWWGLLADGQLLTNVEASLVRSVTGFALAVAVAVPLGLLIGWYKPVAELLNPILEVFRNTAALALLPVFTLLLGIGETSKISIVLYACTWPVLLNTVSAVRTVDPTLLRLARSMDLSPLRLFQKVILPASVPTIFTGIRLAGAVAILVLVAAEMVGAKAGLGFLINNSQFNFAIPQMYAGILTISALGVGCNQLLVALERRFTSWRTA